MKGEKCKKELLRVMSRKDLTSFMKLKMVRRADIAGFSYFVKEALPSKEAELIVEMVAAGSYMAAARASGMEYDSCYSVVTEGYKKLLEYVKKPDVPRGEKDMASVFALLQSGGNQFDVLKKLYSEYGVLFTQLVNKIPMREGTKKKTLVFLEFSTIDEAAEIMACSQATVKSCVARLYHMMLDTARERSIDDDRESFVAKLDLMDTRSRTVVCREGCASVEDVRALLKREKVTGLGVTCRMRINDWLEGINDDT